MKKTATTLLMLAVIMITSCEKEFTPIDQQEWNTGALIWNRKLISITDGNHVTYLAKDHPELQYDGIVFYPDGTGKRYQGKKMFWATPQVEELRFNWSLDPNETNLFYLRAPEAAESDPKNTITVSVSADARILTMTVLGDRAYFIYKYEQTTQ